MRKTRKINKTRAVSTALSILLKAYYLKSDEQSNEIY